MADLSHSPHSPQPFELASEHLGALPIVQAFLVRAGVTRLLGRRLPEGDARVALPAARVIGALICNLCVSREPLYGIGEWAGRHEAGLLGLEAGESENGNLHWPQCGGLIVIRADIGFENHKLFETLNERGIEFSIGVKQSSRVRRLIEQVPESDWVTLTDYPDGGEAQIAEVTFGKWRMIVRRTRLLGEQADLFPSWRHHSFATNRTVPLLTADIDHRDHAQIELVIRDLKDQALAHFPSGNMHANSAWTAIAALAHNLGRWTTQIGQPNEPVQTARSRRRRLFAVPARLTRTSRIWTLRMPARWPWQRQFHTVLEAIRALPALS